MNKSELIDAIAAKAGITKADARRSVDAFMEVTGAELKKGGKVILVGFGTFSVATRSSRKGLNPATKKPITIPAKKVAKFKPGAALAELVKK